MIYLIMSRTPIDPYKLSKCTFNGYTDEWDCIIDNKLSHCETNYSYREFDCDEKDKNGDSICKQIVEHTCYTQNPQLFEKVRENYFSKKKEWESFSRKLENYIDFHVKKWEDLLVLGQKIVQGEFSYAGTGMEEPSMGNWAQAQLIRLNHYVFTTGSTNRPTDPTFQEMWLTFLIPRSLADQLVNLIDRQTNYLYLVSKVNYEPSFECQTLYARGLESFEDSIVNDQIKMNETTRDGCQGDHVKELYDVQFRNPSIYQLLRGPDELVTFQVEDPVKENRNLYLKIINFMQQITETEQSIEPTQPIETEQPTETEQPITPEQTTEQPTTPEQITEQQPSLF